MDLILTGTLASFLAGSATVIGAAAIFFVHRVSKKFLDAAMGFAAGVMPAAIFFSG